MMGLIILTMAQPEIVGMIYKSDNDGTDQQFGPTPNVYDKSTGSHDTT